MALALALRTYGNKTQDQHLTPTLVKIGQNFLEDVACVQKMNDTGGCIRGKLNQVLRDTAIQYRMTEIKLKHGTYIPCVLFYYIYETASVQTLLERIILNLFKWKFLTSKFFRLGWPNFFRSMLLDDCTQSFSLYIMVCIWQHQGNCIKILSFFKLMYISLMFESLFIITSLKLISHLSMESLATVLGIQL